MADDPIDVPTELLRLHAELEANFRLKHDLDVDYPRDPDAPELQDPNRARFENSIAKELLKAVEELVTSPTLFEWRDKLSGTFPIGDLAGWLADRPFVTPQIRFDIARAHVQDLEAEARRTVDLLRILVETQPSERARSYLARVSRCYIAGLDPECLIMCRAVLDAAFEDRVSDSDVKKHVPIRRRRRNIPLSDRIAAAQTMGIIDPHLATVARRLKDAGNDALHNVPVPTVSVLDAVRDTARLLQVIAA